jgi:hypothetical protein
MGGYENHFVGDAWKRVLMKEVTLPGEPAPGEARGVSGGFQ